MNLNELRKWLAILSIAIIIGWLLVIDYSDLRWETNKAGYLGVGSMLLLEGLLILNILKVLILR